MGLQLEGANSVLDLSDWIPEEITGTLITKEVSSDKIEISGRYANGRPFRLTLNRFVDEHHLTFGCGLYAGERNQGRKGNLIRICEQQPQIHLEHGEPARRDWDQADDLSKVADTSPERERKQRPASDGILVQEHGHTPGQVQKDECPVQRWSRTERLWHDFDPDQFRYRRQTVSVLD